MWFIQDILPLDFEMLRFFARIICTHEFWAINFSLNITSPFELDFQTDILVFEIEIWNGCSVGKIDPGKRLILLRAYRVTGHLRLFPRFLMLLVCKISIPFAFFCYCSPRMCAFHSCCYARNKPQPEWYVESCFNWWSYNQILVITFNITPLSIIIPFSWAFDPRPRSLR